MSSTPQQQELQPSVEPASKPVRIGHPGMIDFREAARRVRNSEHYTGDRKPEPIRSWLRRLAGDSTERGLAVQDGGKWWIHPSVHPALSELSSKDRSAAKVIDLPEGKRNKVLAKVLALHDLSIFRLEQGLNRIAARERFARERREFYKYREQGLERVLILTAASLARWQARHNKGGADALAADGRGKYERSGNQPDQAAIDHYWRLRHDSKKYKIAFCWRYVREVARKEHWKWFKKESTCRKWDRRNRNERALVLCREGEQRYTQKCGSYIELDPESFAPGECWVADDHDLDVWVLMPNGDIIRPVLSAIQDWRSRDIVGYAVVRAGNEHAFLAAFRMAAKLYGLPRVFIGDNGKNFTSRMWTGGKPRRHVYRNKGEFAEQYEGIFTLAGIQCSWCLPYNPNGKARLERWFGTVEDQLGKSFASYCGSTPDNRPEEHKKLVAKAVPWDEFISALDRYVSIYRNRPHSAEDMAGKSPAQMMGLVTCKRPLDENILPLLLSAWHRPVSIHRNGVSIKFCGKTFPYGADCRAINDLPIGTKVRISFDPDDMQTVHVWSMDYAHVAEAKSNRRMNRSMPSEALREAIREERRERRTLKQITKLRTRHLHDTVGRALNALERDSARRRLPNPEHPDGGPTLIPVQTPLKDAPAQRRPVAVGAENTEPFMRLEDLYEGLPESVKTLPGKGLLREFGAEAMKEEGYTSHQHNITLEKLADYD